MKVLNRQESDVPDLDDIEGIYEGNEDDDDSNELDDTQRSVKLMLRSKLFSINCFNLLKINHVGGVIPDSTMIHAARKRRQMAREMGTPGDYISLNANSENGSDAKSNRKSRLVRYENIFYTK